MARYGANMLPMGEGFEDKNSPVFHYPYVKTREALLNLARSGELDPCHGIKMEYINPANGGPAMPTVAIPMNATSSHVWRHRAEITPAVRPNDRANTRAKMPSDAETGKPSAIISLTV